MTRIRRALATLLVLASTAAYGAPPPGTLAEASVKAKETYDAARKELLERGKNAKMAALGTDYPAWKAANEAYMQQIVVLTGICEQNVAALTSAPDITHYDVKAVQAGYSQYADVGSSMFKTRLQLLALANLAERYSAKDRLVILKALAPQYLSAE